MELNYNLEHSGTSSVSENSATLPEELGNYFPVFKWNVIRFYGFHEQKNKRLNIQKQEFKTLESKRTVNSLHKAILWFCIISSKDWRLFCFHLYNFLHDCTIFLVSEQ